jgi:hypothetical protein
LAVVIGRQVNKTFLGYSPLSNNVFSWRFWMSRQLNLIFSKLQVQKRSTNFMFTSFWLQIILSSKIRFKVLISRVL